RVRPEDRLGERLRPRRVDVEGLGRGRAGEPRDQEQRHARRHPPVAHRLLPRSLVRPGHSTRSAPPRYAMRQVPTTRGGAMEKIKHIALSTQDPDATAKFYVDVFGMKQVGRIDNPNTTGYYLTDGEINLAILKFKNDKVAGVERGKDWSGIHHFGFQVDDLDDTSEP